MNPFSILVADDDVSICHILKKILQREGYDVCEAHTAAEALNLFNECAPDIVLLDMMLPDGDGIDVAKEMIRQNPRTPIILISAHGTISRAVEATKNGIYDFIEKPFDKEHILLRVRNALALLDSQKELSRLKLDTFAKYRMIGRSPAMRKVYDLIDKIAPTNSPVLILGENGVGKELVAQAVHESSPRAKGKLVRLNCSAIPEELIESELFGHTKGAFTGAYVPRRGRIVDADKGTLFLDEIGDLSLAAQAKILRFLESGEVQQIGTNEIKKVNVRIIAATNKDIEAMVKSGEFREDLFYRLDVLPITVPPLRERREDIPMFVEHFVQEFADANGVPPPAVSPAAMRALTGRDWPGNVRQLRHFIERLLIMVNADLIDIHHINALMKNKNVLDRNGMSLKQARLEFERDFISAVLAQCGGKKTEAARILQMDRANLYRKMKELGI